jgi:type IV pilus assembly protein PilB
MARKKLGQMLVEAGVLSEQSLRAALAEQRRWGGTLGRTLVDMKLVNEPELVRVLAAQLHLQTVDLDHIEIHPSVLDLVPGELAEQYSLVPFAQPMKFLDVAMAEPTNLGIIDELRIRTQLNIRPYLAGPKMIERALAKHYHRGFGGSLRRTDVPLDQTGDVVKLDDDKPSADEIAAARRREGMRPARIPVASRDAEIDVLQERISALEALVARDEEVLRKLLGLLIDKGLATREEILEYIRD